MENSTKYKVAVKCCTYNQAQYITDALNGFVMQETDFPFVCCIIDDASTDGEQEVIRKYVSENFDLSEPDVAYEKETNDAYITYARHKCNKNCFFAVLYLKRNLYHDNEKKDKLVSEWMDDAEYIALCEGDDYWIDARKLKKQVSLLGSDKIANMCYSAFYTVNHLGNKIRRPFFEKCIKRSHSGYIFPDLMKQNFILTLTVLLRNGYDKNAYFSRYDGPSLDYYIFLLASTSGRAVWLDDYTGCYRDNPTGEIRSSGSSVNDKIWKIYKFFAVGYLRGEVPKLNSFAIQFKVSVGIYLRALKRFLLGQDKSFIWDALRASLKI